MNRRKFIEQTWLKGLLFGSGYLLASCRGVFRKKSTTSEAAHLSQSKKITHSSYDPLVEKSRLVEIQPPESSISDDAKKLEFDIREEVDLYNDPSETRHKLADWNHLDADKSYDRPYPDDSFASEAEMQKIKGISRKIQKVQNYVGYGHFNILTFDDALSHMRHSPRLEMLTQSEIAYIEELFYRDANEYGFLGEKVNINLTDAISKRDVVKVPFTGHYLFKEQNEKIYSRLRRDVGKSLILTSGVRSVIKQVHLFLAKTQSVDGNFSQASRSLAPPGYSFHAVGDFDVGKKGLGSLNFTNRFSQTDEFKKIMDLNYIDIRYPTDNPYGVRFEPWHIDGYRRRIKKCSNCG